MAVLPPLPEKKCTIHFEASVLILKRGLSKQKKKLSLYVVELENQFDKCFSKMAAPCALISSCSEKDPVDLVKGIIGTQDLPESACEIEDIQSYPWKVETKYYTADIRICCTKRRTIGDQNFADNVHAFVVHFDSNDPDSFNRVKMWLPFLKEIMPEVQLLVCDRCDGSKGLSKEDAWAWCLENSFELIELDPVIDESSDDDDDFAETLGMNRIIQALHAHTWPNLEMKDESTFRSPYMNKMMAEEAKLNQENERNSVLNTVPDTKDSKVDLSAGDNTVSSKQSDDAGATSDPPTTSDTSKEVSPPNPTDSSLSKSSTKDTKASEPKPEELDFAALALGDGGDMGEESFEQLFENLADMKRKAMELPMDQRKAYAEKVAIGFWRAVCGDEDEIAGLSDGD